MVYLKTMAAVLLLTLSVSVAAHADLTVKYQATHSELVLFKQPQDAPFAKVSFVLHVAGSRIRTEMVDAVGHPWWFIADRASGAAYSLDPVRKLYWRERGAWPCKDMAEQVAAAIARLMQVASVQDLQVSELAGATVGGVPTKAAALRFTGRILGSPQPVATAIDVYFPRSEEDAFGPSASRELYCGQRPSPSQWAEALQTRAGLNQSAATYVGGAITVPMRLAVRANLGIGTAALTLDAAEISRDPIDPAMFNLPTDFAERE